MKLKPEFAEYLEAGGVFCPFCRNEGIVGGPVDIVAHAAFQEVSCTACGATWRDEYRRVGAVVVEEPDPR